jgi:uroporphyrinogen-III decarboxylase
MTPLTSRQRLLRTIDQQETDHLPCCFMSFAILRQRHHDDLYAAALAEKALGLDPMLFIPTASRSERRDHPDLRGLPVRCDPAVQRRQWQSQPAPGETWLHQEFHTPAGALSTSVRLSEDWPHGNHLPFIDDYQVPRQSQPLVKGPEDLEALQYLLTPPLPEDVSTYRQEAARAQAFATDQGVLLAGGWGVGMDMANWLCGMQDLMVHMLERPDFVDELLERIHRWNLRRMEALLSAPLDLYIRRAWYEGVDFVTPRFFRQAILPRLKAEAALAHQHGVRFGYICSSGTKPLLKDYLEAGIDVLIGVDPVQGSHTDLAALKATLGGRVCLWGGVSAAVTVERGSPAEVRAAVDQAIAALGPQGLILSPIDNLTVDEPQTWDNIAVFIDQWKRHW